MKRCLIIGSSGTIGSAIHRELQSDCEILEANFSSGDVQVDIGDPLSITQMFQNLPPLDAIICAAARGVILKPFSDMTISDYQTSTQSKLMGQINLVIEGIKYAQPQASFTLTTGLLNVDPIPKGSAAAMVNAAVEGFVKGAALEMPKQMRVNVVSPALLEESLEHYGPFFQGYETIPGHIVAKSYRKSIFGLQNGHIYKVGWAGH